MRRSDDVLLRLGNNGNDARLAPFDDAWAVADDGLDVGSQPRTSPRRGSPQPPRPEGIEVCRVCHRLIDLSEPEGRCETCSSLPLTPPKKPEPVLRHAEWWCSPTCRELDITAAEALEEHRIVSDRSVDPLELAQSRYRLRKAFLAIDRSRGAPDTEGFAEDLKSGWLVKP